MGLWKVGKTGPEKVDETHFVAEEILEENIEDWICKDPSILGEPLLLIGRQVLIPDIHDRLDLLALDTQGAAVIIELKRGTLKDPVDTQALRYASYISKWQFEDFENEARKYLGKTGDEEYNFNAIFEEFCQESGADDTPDINIEQRIIILGSAIREKLGSVALWLRDHNVDIKVIEMRAYKDGETLYFEPSVIVPLPVSKFRETGRGPKGKPWMEDGKSWHLDKRCSPKTNSLLLSLDKIIQENLEVDGPRWNQKHYIAYRVNNYNWLIVHTMVGMLILDILVRANSFSSSNIASKLDIVEFDRGESYSEKYKLPSSVNIENASEKTDRVRFRVKDDFDLESDNFMEFLLEAYDAWS